MFRTRLLSLSMAVALLVLHTACGESSPSDPTGSTAAVADSTSTSETTSTPPIPPMSATPSMIERIIDSFRLLQSEVDFEIYVPTELPDDLMLAKGSPYVGGPPQNPHERLISTTLLQSSTATPKNLTFMQTGGTPEGGNEGQTEPIEINGSPGTLIRETRDDGPTQISIIWTTADGVLIHVASAYYEPAALIAFAESLTPLSEL